MEDGTSSVKSGIFKQEWKMFWESLLEGEESDEQHLPPLTKEGVKSLIKELSSSRKQINQKLEVLNHEIDQHTSKLDSLRLVGSDLEETITSISQMTDEGHRLSLELDKINQKIEKARRLQDQLSELK